MSKQPEGQPVETTPIRSTEEIRARMEAIKVKMKQNDVWIHSGYSATREPNSGRIYDLYQAKLNELRWFLGEIETPEDVTHY